MVAWGLQRNTGHLDSIPFQQQDVEREQRNQALALHCYSTVDLGRGSPDREFIGFSSLGLNPPEIQRLVA
jgi:hypothetical protein